MENYLSDMSEAMHIVRQTLGQTEARRDAMLNAFLNFRPDVVDVTSYDAAGQLLDCWALGRDPKELITANLSFDYERARAGADVFMTAPHVATIFDRYYPWVVTMTARLDGEGPAQWVSLDLSFASLSSYINNVGIGTRGYCFLLDDAGNLVYHPAAAADLLRPEKRGHRPRWPGWTTAYTTTARSSPASTAWAAAAGAWWA